VTELWNWRIDDRVAPEEIHAALADVVGQRVLPLNVADPARLPPDVLLCDVWYGPGDFPTFVDCYAAPEELAEESVLAGFARRLGRDCLLPDDTLDAGRHLLVIPDGTIRPVHFDVRDTDDGETLSNRRLCTSASPRCRGWSHCHRSRWAPDTVVPALAAA
jgi:hypothetical protein